MANKTELTRRDELLSNEMTEQLNLIGNSDN